MQKGVLEMARTADNRLSQRSSVRTAIAAGYLSKACEECGSYTLTTNGEIRECHTCEEVTSN